MTQKQKILSHLLDHPSGITSKEAFEQYGITRLAAVVHELRKEIAVRSKDESCITRLGNKATYSRYFIKEEDVKHQYGAR